MSDAPDPNSQQTACAKLTPEAKRARAEAEARRRAARDFAPAQELGGRGGLEPTRYGDWEAKGLISDF